MRVRAPAFRQSVNDSLREACPELVWSLRETSARAREVELNMRWPKRRIGQIKATQESRIPYENRASRCFIVFGNGSAPASQLLCVRRLRMVNSHFTRQRDVRYSPK